MTSKNPFCLEFLQFGHVLAIRVACKPCGWRCWSESPTLVAVAWHSHIKRAHGGFSDLEILKPQLVTMEVKP